MAIVLDGIVLGLQFALLGLGLTLIYGLGGILNLAHGQLAVVGALTAALAIKAGAPAALAALVAVAAAALVGLVLDQTLMRPVYRREGEERVLLSLLLTLGTALLIDGVLIWRFPFEALSLRIGGDAVPLLGVPMRTGSLLASALSIAAIAAMLAFLRGTRTGRAVRSIIQDEEGAKLCGINPAAMRTLIFALSGALAGLMVVAQSMTTSVTATSGLNFTILALIVTVVGGLGRVTGALYAGLLLGVVNTLSSFYIGAFVTSIILLAAAALTILLRPQGLAGKAA